MNITHKYSMKEVLKTLTIKALHIEDVKFSDKTSLLGNSLSILNNFDVSKYSDIKDFNIAVIEPTKRDIEVNSVLDIIPISVKAYGVIGTGITHTLTGVYILLTSTVNNELQLKNFGKCHGILKDVIEQNKIGTFEEDDILIHIDITINNDDDLKKSIYSVHSLCDDFITTIRKELKEYDGTKFTETHTYNEKYNKGGKRVVLIKQLSGQGAMENNIILPNEPSGVLGGKTIMDYNNTPIVLSPNEYRDGAIRTMT